MKITVHPTLAVTTPLKIKLPKPEFGIRCQISILDRQYRPRYPTIHKLNFLQPFAQRYGVQGALLRS